MFKFSGLGDDSKLPIQLRLLTAASKQHNFKTAADKQHQKQLMNSFSQEKNSHRQKLLESMMKSESSSFKSKEKQSAATTAAASSPFKLSEYMYLDKNEAMQRNHLLQQPHQYIPPKPSTGFSIDDIMK